MSQRNFWQMLETQFAAGKFGCIGLDSSHEYLPSTAGPKRTSMAQVTFSNRIVDVTKQSVFGYKFNNAFYPNTAGAFNLKKCVGYAQTDHSKRNEANNPDVPVILDGKYGDTFATNEKYAKTAFEDLNADAVTVHPTPGARALEPFLERSDKGIFVVCRMSGEGSGEFQDRLMQVSDAEAEAWGLEQGTLLPFYQIVAYRVSREWNTRGNCGLVVGANELEALQAVRAIDDTIPILAPGVGAQGGSFMDVYRVGRNKDGAGIIPSMSRSVIYASDGEDYADAALRAFKAETTQERKEVVSA